MLFGTSMYKMNKLHAQHELTSVNMRLNKAKKSIKNRQKYLSQATTNQYNIFLAGKNDFVMQRTQQYLSMDIQNGEPTSGENMTQMQAQSLALTDWNNEAAMQKQYLEELNSEENDAILQACNQEEQDLTIESSYWQEMIEYWDAMIKQAEQWFRDSLRALFGGGPGGR